VVGVIRGVDEMDEVVDEVVEVVDGVMG